MTKYLGIDYGLAHIGLASAETTLATPLPPLKNDAALATTLASLVLREGITTVVCGIPEGALARTIRQFVSDLSDLTRVPVILHKETLSTQEAKQKLRESGANRTKRQNDHSYAACLILEDYLEFKNSVD